MLALALYLLAIHYPTPQLGQLDAPRPKLKQFVVYASEAQVIPAGKPSVLELRFRVQPGYHVNSHKPNSDLQIPTEVLLQPQPDLHLEPAQYPPGQTYTLTFDPTEKLNVYTGDFTVKLPVLAQPGTHQLHGQLKYQACDQAACYPPKTLPLDILFTAKQ